MKKSSLCLSVLLSLSALGWSTSNADPAAPAPAPVATPSAPAAEVPLVDGRVLAVGLGFIGGIAVLNFFTGGMGTPMLAAGGAAEGTLFAAGRAAGGRLITASSGVLGGLVGDYLYRWNGATPAPANP